MSKEILYVLGVQLLGQGRYQDALLQFDKAKAAAYPADDPALNYNLGLAYVGLGRCDCAITAFAVAAGNDSYPRHVDALQSWVCTYYNKFNQELRAHNFAAASMTFDRMLDTLPKDKDVSSQYLLSARSQLLKSYIEDSITAPAGIISAMQKYLDIGVTVMNEDTLYFCATMGKIYLDCAVLTDDEADKSMLLQSAEELLRYAHTIGPGDQALLNNLAIVKDTLGKWQEAVHLIARSAIITDGSTLKDNLVAILMNHLQTDLALKVTGDITDADGLIHELEAI